MSKLTEKHQPKREQDAPVTRNWKCCIKGCDEWGTMTPSITGPDVGKQDTRRWYCRKHGRQYILHIKVGDKAQEKPWRTLKELLLWESTREK